MGRGEMGFVCGCHLLSPPGVRLVSNSVPSLLPPSTGPCCSILRRNRSLSSRGCDEVLLPLITPSRPCLPRN